jgi:hypothetical protein
MSTLRHPLTWSADWIKRRLAAASDPKPACASPSCTERENYWRRLRSQSGALLDGKFYCRAQCLETALAGHLSRLLAATHPVPPPNRIPLGLLMVARGKLTHTEVRAALEAQRRGRHCKIGDWFEKLGFASEQDVTAALALQWGCPVVSSFDLAVDPGVIDSPSSIPLPILEAFQMLPVNYAATTSTLYLAFGERVDHAALYAIERTLGCRTQACVARRKSVVHRLESMSHLSHPNDVEFVTRDLSEMLRITLSYINRLSPGEIQASRIGRFIWLRLWAAARSPRPHFPATNLVFCLEAKPFPTSRPSVELHSSSVPLPAVASWSQSGQDDGLDSIGR